MIRTMLQGGLTMLLFAAVTLPAGAEVGTYEDSGRGDASDPVVLESKITDDGDPFQFWAPTTSEESRAIVLNPNGAANFDGEPSILIHPLTRTPFAAWSRRSESGYDIVVSRFVDGAWTTPEVVADELDDAVDAHLVADRTDGTLHLFYGVSSPIARIAHRTAAADGSGWSAADIVSDPVEHASRPTATFHGSSLFVTYERKSGDVREIVVAEANAGSWTRSTIAGSAHDAPTEPQIHSDGQRVWVDWIDAPGIMLWTLRESDVSWSPVGFEPFTDFEDREYHVRGRVERRVRE